MGAAAVDVSGGLEEDTRNLLKSDAAADRALGLEILHTIWNKSLHMPDLEPFLADPNPSVRDRALQLTRDADRGEHYRPRFMEWLASPERELVVAGLHGLVGLGLGLDGAATAGLQEHPDRLVRILAGAAHIQYPESEASVVELRGSIADAGLDDASARVLLMAVKLSGNRKLFRLAKALAGTEHAGADEDDGLMAAAEVASFNDSSAIAKVEAELSADPEVRVMALDMLAHVEDLEAQGLQRKAMEHPSYQVRQAAARAIATFGAGGYEIAVSALGSIRWEVSNTGIMGLREYGPQRVGRLLLEHHSPLFELAHRCREWAREASTSCLVVDPLRLVLADYMDRVVDRALLVLEAMGHGRVINTVRLLLNSNQSRLQASALETLDSLNVEEVVRPLLPLIADRMDRSDPQTVPSPARLTEVRGQLAGQMAHADDRWLRVGAMVTLFEMGHGIPRALADYEDQLVFDVCTQLNEEHDQGKGRCSEFLDRLFFLKQLELFRGMTLDHLLTINLLLKRQDCKAGDTIVEEGTPGTVSYIISSGEVAVSKGAGAQRWEVNTLGRMDIFGEMAMFDTQPRSATVSAKTDVVLFELEQRLFKAAAYSAPDILIRMAQIMAERLRQVNRSKQFAVAGSGASGGKR